jgi:hypothetical protein
MYPKAKMEGLGIALEYGIESFSFEVKWRKILLRFKFYFVVSHNVYGVTLFKKFK